MRHSSEIVDPASTWPSWTGISILAPPGGPHDAAFWGPEPHITLFTSQPGAAFDPGVRSTGVR